MITQTSSTGEICSRWPSLAPAARHWKSTTRLPGRIPRRVMSSLKEVMVSGSAIFGSAT